MQFHIKDKNNKNYVDKCRKVWYYDINKLTKHFKVYNFNSLTLESWCNANWRYDKVQIKAETLRSVVIHITRGQNYENIRRYN